MRVRVGSRRSVHAAVALTFVVGAAVLAAAPASAAPIATTTTVTLSAATAHPYQPFTATAAVTPAASAGTVTFTRSGATLCGDVAVAAGSASCAANLKTTSAGAPVTATFTPADATVAGASTGSSPNLAITKWPVTLSATYSDTATTCPQRTATVKIARATDGPSPVAGLPKPSGSVELDGMGNEGAGGSVPPTTFTTCFDTTSDVPTASYSGDTLYVAAKVTATRVGAIVNPGHTRNGSGNPVAGGAAPGNNPGHTRNGFGGGGLTNSGPSHVEPLLGTGAGLVLAGFALLVLGRRRPERRASC